MSKVLIISGAGTGVDSGIKTFRTDTTSGKALWDDFDINDVCDYPHFKAGYDRYSGKINGKFGVNKNGDNYYTLTHQFYNMRRKELASVNPNIFHRVVSELYHKYGSDKVVNITTNVDDLLERAGMARNDVLHVHGYLPEIRYSREDNVIIKDIGYSEINNEFDKLKSGDLVIVVGCSNQVINFNWELFPVLNIGVRMCVVNPDINCIEQREYEERGVIVYRDTSSNVFGDNHFINFVQNVLER